MSLLLVFCNMFMPNISLNIFKYCKRHRHGNHAYSCIFHHSSCLLYQNPPLISPFFPTDVEPCIPCLSASWFYLSASKKPQLFGRLSCFSKAFFSMVNWVSSFSPISPISRKISFDGLKHLADLLRSLRPEWRLHVSVTCQEKQTDQLKLSAEAWSTHCNTQF